MTPVLCWYSPFLCAFNSSFASVIAEFYSQPFHPQHRCRLYGVCRNFCPVSPHDDINKCLPGLVICLPDTVDVASPTKPACLFIFVTQYAGVAGNKVFSSWELFRFFLNKVF